MLGQILLFLLIFILLLVATFSFFQPPNQSVTSNNNHTEDLWERQKEQSKRESEAEKNKEWFSEKRWLTDKEIDWATERIAKNDRFKILPSHQFHYIVETKGTAEAGAYLAFPELLHELTSFKGDLVFIPVNNPDFHWSLLIHNTNDSRFYHYDTLRGANDYYITPLVKELSQQIWSVNNDEIDNNFDDYLVKLHAIRQNNGYDCGVAVIAIIQRIIEKYQGNSLVDLKTIELGEFDFTKARKGLRKKYLSENGEN